MRFEFAIYRARLQTAASDRYQARFTDRGLRAGNCQVVDLASGDVVQSVKTLPVTYRADFPRTRRGTLAVHSI